MGKTKHTPPEKKKKEEFIKFSKVQASYLNEILLRQQGELNEAITVVYEDLGIADKILKAKPGTYVLRKDFSGLDVLPIISVPPDPPAPAKTPKKDKDH